MPNTKKYTTFKETYNIGKEIAGNYRNLYNRSLIFYIVAYIFQGFAYLSIYQILAVLFNPAVKYFNAWVWLGLFAIFTIVNSVCRWFAHDFDYTGTLPNVMHDMRIKLGKKLRTIPLERLNRYKTGDLNSSLSSNVDESVSMLGMVSGMFFEITVTPTIVVLGVLFIDWRISVIMAIMMLLAIPLYIKKRKDGYSEKSSAGTANAELESDIIEYIQGLPVLRATNQTGTSAKRLHDSILNVHHLQKSSLGKTNLVMLLADMIILIMLILVSVMGSFWIGTSMSIAALASIMVMISRLMEPMSIFLAITGILDIMSTSFSRLKDVLNIRPLSMHKPEEVTNNNEVRFKDVSFKYFEQSDYALKNLSITIPEKSMTAIVGPSGSGKTTITKMMMRYADPEVGSITIGGANIKNMSQENLLKYFSVVFQDVYLFDENIIENIRMSKPSATDREVEKAAKAAYCHEFIKRLPNGYQTQVGDIGGSLSGGERQRISIARAILKDAPIVILDEPTAALDTESELAVQKAIDALLEDKSVLVIAHRLSTIAGADKIIVMDEGELVEYGTHKDLLELKGRYNDLWQAQLRSKEWHLGDVS